MMKSAISLTLVFTLLAAVGAVAQDRSPARPSYNRLLERGIEQFYRTDWREASNTFETLKATEQEDARAYFFDAMIPFWSYFFVEDAPATAERFFEKSIQAIEITRKQLEATPTDTNLVLLLSGLYGYRSLVAADQGEYRMALKDGMDGYTYTRQLLQLDSEDPRAKIGKGIFYYMIGTVPKNLRWLTNMAGFVGDKEQGLQLLEEAANAGSYVNNDARMILAYLYRQQKRWDEALTHLDRLCEKYPTNTIFRFNYAETLEQSNRRSDARKAYQEVIALQNPHLSQLVEASRRRLNQM